MQERRRITSAYTATAVLGGLAAGGIAYLLWMRANREHRRARGGLTSCWVKVDDLKLHARISVDPAPDEHSSVVLVHGLGMSSRYMVPLLEHLAREFRVYAPDLPGFGLSDKPPRALTVPELADCLYGFMQAMGLRRAALVGNSLGCEIVVEFANRYPGLADRLVLQGPTPDLDARSVYRQAALLVLTGLFERWSLAWVAVSDYFRGGVRRYIATYRNMMEHRIGHKLGHVQAPTLVVWGTRDYLIPYTTVEQMARALPDSKLVVVRGAAHGMNYSHPCCFVAAISPFLSEGHVGPPAPPHARRHLQDGAPATRATHFTTDNRSPAPRSPLPNLPRSSRACAIHQGRTDVR
jgi:2-hydroxy-6-oxonona-2,4-dienedioate hydrolase